jgi:hypothetical protein
MKKQVLVAILVLVIASQACNFGTTPAPVAGQPSDVLFQDDFSNKSSGWDSVSDEDGVTDYVDGAYRIFVNKTQFDFWANPGQSLPADVRVEVDVTKTAGPDINDIGIICRYNQSNDVSTFYYLYITSEGFANISKIENDEPSTLSEEITTPNPAIKTGNASNRLRADCVGSTLTLYVNDQQVLTTTDSSIAAGGDVGLIAGTFDESGTDILFDNFIVTKP